MAASSEVNFEEMWRYGALFASDLLEAGVVPRFDDTPPILAKPCQLTLNFWIARDPGEIRRRKPHGAHVFPGWC